MSTMRPVIHLLPFEQPDAVVPDDWRAWALATLPAMDRLVAACRTVSARRSSQMFLIGRNSRDGDDDREQELSDGGILRIDRIRMHSTRVDDRLALLDRSRESVAVVLAQAVVADALGDPRTWPLRLALSGRAAVRDVAAGAAIPYPHPEVRTGVTETLTRALDRPEMTAALHGNTRPIEGTLASSCPWNDGYAWATVEDGNGDRRNLPLAYDELPPLPDMMILEAGLKRGPFIGLRGAYLVPDDCRPDRSPIDRLRDSSVLERLIARAAPVESGSGDADRMGDAA